jgi:hypothetical protein
MKILLWLVLIGVVLHLLRKKSRAASAPAARRTDRAAASQAAEPMVQCAYCATYIPQSESLPALHGQVFCCAEHRALHAGS